ncbi:MAG: lipid II:glycine glycyltransferase FemX [Coprobacillaceae bacterium]
MKYVFKTNINKNEYDAFIKSNSCVSFMQEYGWAKVKKDWQHLHCALYENDTIVAACLVMIRSLPLGFKIFYVPKGYVVDFENAEIVSTFTKEIVKEAKKRKGYVLKIDPNFCIKETSIQEILDKQEMEYPTFTCSNYEIKHQNLMNAGFALQKRELDLDSTTQPRFNMTIPLVDSTYKQLDALQLKNNFRKKIRRYFGNFHKERGVYYEHTKDITKIDEFIEMINKTEERQHIVLRNKEYFENIMRNNNAYLFFGKLDLKTYENFLSTKGKVEELESIHTLLKQGKDNITISSSLVIIPKNENGIRTSEYLYTGNDLTFSKLYASYGLVYNICQFSIEQNCHFLNLGGVDGTLEDHLSMFKARFNPIVWEFSGEYDYILSPLYYPIEKFLPIVKRYYRKLKHIKQ